MNHKEFRRLLLQFFTAMPLVSFRNCLLCALVYYWNRNKLLLSLYILHTKVHQNWFRGLDVKTEQRYRVTFALIILVFVCQSISLFLFYTFIKITVNVMEF